MPDYFTTVTAEDPLTKITKEQATALARGLGLPEDTDLPVEPDTEFHCYSHEQSAYTIEWDPKDGELYIYAEDYASTGDVPDAFWTALGLVLKEKKLPYLEFGWASHCSKPCAGSFGGGEFRVYPDGSVIYAKLVHPRHKVHV